MWSVTGAVASPPDIAGFEAAQARGFYSLLFLVQALGQQQALDPVVITVVGDQLQSITAQETLNPEKTPILGLCQVIPQEYPNLTSRCIDIVLPGRGRHLERLAELLIYECASPAVPEGIAYRGAQRWAQRFEPLRLEPEAAPPAPLRPGGVYLLTGGLAEIGLEISEYLARTVQPRLILVENGEFPERADWDEWLANYGDQDSISQKIRRAQALEGLGAQVLVAGIEGSEPGQLRELIGRVLERYGALHGVVHAATVVGEQSFRAIQETDPVECGWHFAAKAHGLLLLEQALQDHQLDFCLLVSSLSAFLGGRGYAAYAAANHYLDAAIQRHNKTSVTPWISVNWDAWQLAGAKMTAMSQDLAQVAMTPEEGGEAFRRATTLHDIGQVVVSTADLPARIAQWQQRLEAARGTAGATGGVAGPRHARPTLPTAYVAPETDLERMIAEVWQNTLGFEEIGIHDNFFDLGGDSLIAIRVVARLKEALSMDISVVSLYERLTIKDLATWLAQGGDAAQNGNPFEDRAVKMSRRKQFRQMKRAGR
jgi:NAD(P)-dependent dehydrogenase (short-subunit alcohol dehydrogenase family)/acyl carrier protein